MESFSKFPGCSHHCDRNNLQCGKGVAYFNGEITPHSEHIHGHSEGKKRSRHEGKCHRHHCPEFSEGSLADLMSKCGHRLFHGGDDSMFAILTEEETAVLKKLLSKMLAN